MPRKPQAFVSYYESGARRLDLLELRQICHHRGPPRGPEATTGRLLAFSGSARFLRLASWPCEEVALQFPRLPIKL
jgi:hypothetical protein